MLILDEPTDGLDPLQKHEVRTLISEIAREKTIVISTHILEEVDAVCTRAIIIARGKLVADDTPAGLRVARALRPARRRVPRRRGLTPTLPPRSLHLKPVGIILRRELASYFATPLAYVFIVIFLVLTGLCAFYLGGLFERGQADLLPFFNFLPWLYLFLVPAVSMRLWAEERKTGSIELLLTQPITMWQAVLGKFLAAWMFIGIALALTFPIWITVNYLGNPDNGAIFAGYIGAFVMAGAFLAVGSCMSALTNNQVIAFVLAFVVCVAVRRWPASPMVTDWSRALFRASLVAFWGGPARRHRVLRRAAHRRHRRALLPHALREHHEGRARPARRAVLRAGHRVLPAREHRRCSTRNGKSQ